MERNAWTVAQDIALWIDDAPVLSDYIMAFVTEREEDTFFINRTHLQEYIKASEGSRTHIPGYNYLAKISSYISNHYEIGELYMEFLKDTCKIRKGQQCSSCAGGWLGPIMIDRIPRSFPDVKTLNYKSVFNSPTYSLDGKIRPVDDYMPRAQIKKYFSRKKLETAKEIEEFSCTFVVSEDLVKTYVDHLKHLEFLKSLRNKATTEKWQNREAKTYEDYNWNELVLTGGLSSLYVCELNTYLKNIHFHGKKTEK